MNLNVDFNNYRIEFACPVKLCIDEEINNNEEIDYFSNEVTSSNFKVIYSYKLVFNIDKLKVNIESFICLILILIQCLIFLYYCIVGRSLIFDLNNNNSERENEINVKKKFRFNSSKNRKYILSKSFNDSSNTRFY